MFRRSRPVPLVSAWLTIEVQRVARFRKLGAIALGVAVFCAGTEVLAQSGAATKFGAPPKFEGSVLKPGVARGAGAHGNGVVPLLPRSGGSTQDADVEGVDRSEPEPIQEPAPALDTSTSGAGNAMASDADDPRVALALAALGRIVRIDVEGIELMAALRCLEIEAELSFRIDREVSERLRREPLTATLACEGTTLATALATLLEPHGLALAIFEGEVLIVDRERVMPAADTGAESAGTATLSPPTAPPPAAKNELWLAGTRLDEPEPSPIAAESAAPATPGR